MKLQLRFAILILPLLVSSCVSLSPTDRAQLRDVQSLGLPVKKRKDPVAAAALNLLPGFGNFYLAIGTDQGGQAAIGFVNLLVWPFSPVWAIPQAAIDANTINTQYTVYYYTIDPSGKKLLDQALYNSHRLNVSDEAKRKL